jgi:hypothetical protein
MGKQQDPPQERKTYEPRPAPPERYHGTISHTNYDANGNRQERATVTRTEN